MIRLNHISRVVTLLALLTLAACQSGSRAPVPQGQTLDEVLSQLAALPTPDGVSQSDFSQLKGAFRQQLIASKQTRFVGQKPRSPQGEDITLVDNGDGTATLTWLSSLRGDYDLNGYVNISDLTPLGRYLNQQVTSASPVRMRVVDGDRNGFINIADLTPLGAGLGQSITGYEVYFVPEPGALCWDSADTVSAMAYDQPNYPYIQATVPYTGKEQFKVVAFNPDYPAAPEDEVIPTDPPPAIVPGTVQGVVTNNIGTPLAGVTVSTDGQADTSTDANGRYVFLNLDPTDSRVITFRDPAHTDGCIKTAVVAGQAVEADTTLLARPNPVTINAGAGGTVESLVTSVKLVLPPNALVDKNGVPLTNDVGVKLTYIDPTDPTKLNAAPGDMSAALKSGDTAQLESYGMAEVFIDDGSGSPANLAAGQSAEIDIPIAPELQATAAPTMPMFSFDEASGQWVEEGTAIKDQSGTKYVLQVPHFSYWNADNPLAESCIGVKVQLPDGTPLQGASVHSEGVDYTGATDRDTDENGMVYIPVKANATEAVSATLAGVTTDVVQVQTPDANGRCFHMQAEDIPTVATLTVDAACLKVKTIVNNGHPIVGAAVSASGSDFNSVGYTNDQGVATVWVKPGVTATVNAEIDGFTAGPQSVTTPTLCDSQQNPLELTISYNLPPTPLFSMDPPHGSVPLNVTLDASASTDSDGSITKYEWDFDGYIGPGGFEDFGSTPTAQHQYTLPGYYYPVLRVTDDQGRTSTLSKYICFE